MKRTITAAMVAVAAGTFGASDSRADDGWRLLTLAEAEEVVEKARAFEQAERYRRRVASLGADWYGSLRLVGDEEDSLLLQLVQTDGRRFRVDMPEGTTPVDVNRYVYRPRWLLFGFLTVRDILVTSKSQAIPGTSVVVRHVFGGKRRSDVQPRGCTSYYASASPVTLYARGFETFLNGQERGVCAWGGDAPSPAPRQPAEPTVDAR